jgi:hypothetical protein
MGLKDERENGDAGPEKKDILAMIIAQLEILLPLAAISIGGMALILSLITKCWMN